MFQNILLFEFVLEILVCLFASAYTEDVLREMQSQPEQLSVSQYLLLRQRLRDLYDHIRHHPALHQRYLWVGKGRPDVDPDIRTQRQVSI